jgi:tetrahydromethanopterin S-methyltransferase subunit F
MVEILKSFEQVASRFSPAVLVAPGLAMLALGLVTWLAGMCRRRLVLGLVGALTGGLAGFLVGEQSLLIAALAAAGSTVLGAGVPRLYVAVVLALLGVAIAFAVLARGQVFQTHGLLLSGQVGQADTRLTTQESLDAVQAYVLDVRDRLEAVARQLAPANVALIVGIGVGLLVVGLLLVRLTGALMCSLVGSGLVFAGMTLLLIFKGSAPVARMEQQAAFYGLVLLGMAAFGTLEQMLLCPGFERGREASAGESRSHGNESKRGWRNR